MRIAALVSSLTVAVVLSGCGVVRQDVTRSNTDHLSFSQNADAVAIQEQANALNLMADQLVRRSTVRGAVTGAAVTCGLAALSVGSAQSCVVGAAAGGVAGAAVGRAKGEREVAQRVELVSANALVRSIRGMNGQMSAIELSLPELLAEQDAELADLQIRRATRAVTQKEYENGVRAIRESRATIAEALTLTIEQTEVASRNMTVAMQQGQLGLDWHLNAANQLGREAHSARSTISPIGPLSFAQDERVALNAAPRSGELR
ncbi:hypothetical protein [Tateyamaria sp.]|uniref:hypothetical protein n=2 Tax=Tateyamaria sp. TaxID=1929288 RepID=UPI00329B49F0